MRLYLTRPRSSIKAVADYDMASKSFVVLKDSVRSCVHKRLSKVWK